MKKLIYVKCSNCGKEIGKTISEYNRSIKIGRRFFCSRSCSCLKGNEEMPKEIRRGLVKNFKGLVGHKKDEYTKFRYLLSHIKYRYLSKRPKTCEIDLDYLKGIWESQLGKCPFSGCDLILPKNMSVGWDVERNWKRASIDRIDNSKGYIKGNIRFTSFMANIAKSTLTDLELIEFCKKVNDYNENKNSIVDNVYYDFGINILGKNRDKYSNFRYFMKVVKNKNRSDHYVDGEMNLEYLYNLWKSQNGVCPISGFSLILPHSACGWKCGKSWERASLDRIDNSKGYIKGNVRFVSHMANIARNNMSDNDLIEFCKAVANYKNTGEI